MKRFVAACSLSLLGLLAGCSDGALDDGSEDAVQSVVAGELKSGVAKTGLSGAARSNVKYSFAVPAGAKNLKFQISGGTGDADLYVKFGAEPTTSSYDFRPYLDGNEETVTPPDVKAGTWYVMLRGYTAYSGVTLVASFEAPTTTPDPAPNPGALDCNNSASWPAAWVAFEDKVHDLTNKRRAAGATCGGVTKPAVPPLAKDENLRKAARCHSLDMAKQNYMAHTSKDGRSPWDRIKAAGYTGFGNAENVAAGQSTPEQVVEGWMKSTGHCNNIMTSGSNELGVGYAFESSSDYDHYWTQNFGKR